MTITFSGLVRQYDESSQAGKAFLALTPSGPQFVVRGFFHRLIDRIFRGFSYDLCESANNLKERALKVIKLMDEFEASAQKVTASPLTSRKTRSDLEEYSKKILTARETELLAAFRIIKIANNLLQHSLEKTPEGSRKGFLFLKTTTQRERALSSLSSITDAIAERVGKKQGRKKLEILVENECYPEVMKTILSEDFQQGIDPEKLERALQVACDQKNTLPAVALIRNKVSSKNLRNIGPQFIAEMARELLKATKVNDDETLSHLIDEQESVGNNLELFLEAISKQFPLSVRKFVEKNRGLLEYVNDEKNTILHTAFLTGNGPICRFLVQHLDPLKRNLFNQTPLQAMLEPKGKNASQPRLQPVNIKTFIENLSARDEKDPIKFRSNDLSALTQGRVPNETQIDLLELFFLLGEPLSELSSLMTRAHLETTISFLKKRYPLASFDEFFLSFFSVNKDYLKTGCEKLSLPREAPKNTPLSSLYELFDNITWDKKEACGLYARVFEHGKGTDNPVSELRAKLESLIYDIEHKKVAPGTPSGGKPLDDFYFQIELCLRHTASFLLKKKNMDRTLAFIKELLIASKYSGERHLQTITNLYRQTRYNDESTRSEFFGRLFLGYRRICLEAVLRELYGISSDVMEQITLDHSEELGIVAPKTTSDTPRSSTPYDWPRVEKAFFEKAYTSHAIVYDFLLPLLHQDDEVRKMYIALQRDSMPPTWNDVKYAPILDALRKIHGHIADRTKLKKAILSAYNITRRREGERAADAVEKDRRADYMKTLVRDSSGSWNVSGLILLLEQIGILSCRIEKAPTLKRLSFVPRSQSLLDIFTKI